MSVINVPKYYENERGILKESGKLIRNIGNHSLIIGGNTALNKVKKILFKSLDENGIKYEIGIFNGYPTLEKIDIYERQVLENNNDVIIGIGGGKVMDLVKAIGDRTGLPVVTIPTIPATCAAWSALSVIYKDNGEQDLYIHLKNSPELIIADKEILSSAPIRYINSGVADTIVKWYEIHPDLKNNISVEALKGVSLEIDKADIFGIIGYSGSGKSTLIRCINFLEKPDSGEVIVNGKNLLNLSESELNRERQKILLDYLPMMHIYQRYQESSK